MQNNDVFHATNNEGMLHSVLSVVSNAGLLALTHRSTLQSHMRPANPSINEQLLDLRVAWC